MNAATKDRTNEWLTPPHSIEALGPFDLDPCAQKLHACNLPGHIVNLRDF